MRIAVFVKAILDPEAPPGMIRFDGRVEGGPTPYVLGPFESNALELGKRLSEATGSPFTAVASGGPEAEVALRKALALGAERAIRVEGAPGYRDPFDVAADLARASGEADVYVFGRQAGDFDQGVTAGLFAGKVGAAFVPLVQGVETDGGALRLRREIPGGYEELTVRTPVVLSATNGPLTLMRLPKVKDVMLANRRPIEVLPSGAAEDASSLEAVRPRDTRRAGRRLAGDLSSLASALAAELEPFTRKGGA